MAYSLKIITAEDPLSDEFGCQYNTEKDTMNTKPGLFHNGLKFHGAIIAQKPAFTIQNGMKIKHLTSSSEDQGLQKSKGAH